MKEAQESELAIFADAASGLPDATRRGLFGALGWLVGELKAIPSALVRRPAQAIDDTTQARSMITSELARAVADKVANDPEVLRAAQEIYLPTNVRRAVNRLRVAEQAVRHSVEAETENGNVSSTTPNEDWMSAFTRFAEDASSERLQDLFGRILAGEVAHPTTYSLATLRAVAELDQATAQDFSLVWEKSVGRAVEYSPEFRRGEWFSRWKRLADAGLMASNNIVTYLPDFKPAVDGCSIWSPMSVDGTAMLVYFSQGCNAEWHNIEFTRVGRELGSILAPPNFERNIRKASQNLHVPGVVRIELISADKAPEVLYRFR
jgi:hypothetical protein